MNLEIVIAWHKEVSHTAVSEAGVKTTLNWILEPFFYIAPAYSQCKVASG